MTTSRDWFLVGFHTWGLADGHTDIHLSDRLDLDEPTYRPPCGAKLEPRPVKPSQLRYCTIDNCDIRRGHGEGTLTIDGRKFEVTNAWGGLCAKDYKECLLYTVRLRGLDKEWWMGLMKRIIVDEGGWVEKDMTVDEWLKEIVVCQTLEDYEAKLVQEAEAWNSRVRESMKKMAGMSEELFQQLDEHHTPEGRDRRLADLQKKREEGKLIHYEKFLSSLPELEPWDPNEEED